MRFGIDTAKFHSFRDDNSIAEILELFNGFSIILKNLINWSEKEKVQMKYKKAKNEDKNIGNKMVKQSKKCLTRLLWLRYNLVAT